MKTTKEEILLVSLRLFAEKGFDAVSTSMIAGELGITKGALYRHFENKQQIFDRIIQKMFELDEARANEDHVPAKSIEEAPDTYVGASFPDFCEFTINQLEFWTEDPFASAFRKMITIEQYKSAEAQKRYQDVICMGPVKYTADLFGQMLKEHVFTEEAALLGAKKLAFLLFAPLKLAIELIDGGADKDIVKAMLRSAAEDFQNSWIQA